MEPKPIDIDELTKPFPQDAIETRPGSHGKMLSYLKTHAVINRLNRACDYRWDWRIIDQYMQGDVLVCRGELTIPGLGTKAGVGVQELRPNGGVDLLKGASSDAMKKAATMFGVGIELYGEDKEDPEYVPKQQAPVRPAITIKASGPYRQRRAAMARRLTMTGTRPRRGIEGVIMTTARAEKIITLFFNQGGFDAGFDEEAMSMLFSQFRVYEAVDEKLLRNEAQLLQKSLNCLSPDDWKVTSRKTYSDRNNTPDASWVAGLREPCRP